MKIWLCWILLFAMPLHAIVLSNCDIPVPVERFINNFGEEAQKKFKLEIVAMNDQDDLGGSVLYLLFDYFGDLDIKSGRKLLINVTQAFLDKIANDTTLTNYFSHYPLTLCDISIKIRHRKPCGFNYPSLANIDSILLQDRRIYYQTINSNTYAINVLRTESYEFAQEVLARDNPGPSNVYDAFEKALEK